jgi:hypothetical protein
MRSVWWLQYSISLILRRYCQRKTLLQMCQMCRIEQILKAMFKFLQFFEQNLQNYHKYCGVKQHVHFFGSF